MIPCDLHIRHFYVLNSIIDVFRFFYKERNEIKEANKFLNNVSFGSSYKSLKCHSVLQCACDTLHDWLSPITRQENITCGKRPITGGELEYSSP